MDRGKRGARASLVAILFCGIFLCDVAAAEDELANTDQTTHDIVVAADGSYVETSHSERLAANDAGLITVSRVSLPYDARMQDFTVVEAYTLKPDGTRIPVDPASIYEQSQPDAGHYATYADLRAKIVQFPQFTVGDKAVFTTRSVTAHPYFAGQFIKRDVFFPGTLRSDVVVTISVPKTMALKVDNTGLELSRREEAGRSITSLHYRKTDAAKLDIFFSLNKIPQYSVSTFRDYTEMGRAVTGLVEPKVVVTAKIKTLADEITGASNDRSEEARKLYEWVTRNIRYVAIELGRGSFEPHEVDSILANGYGDCKDHDVLLRALLKAKNISSNSILINGSAFYTLGEAPSFAQLNHVITFVPELHLYLDSSDAIAPFGVLSANLYGKPAIRLGPNSAERITLPPAEPSSSRTDVVERLTADGNISGSVKTTASGPLSFSLRGSALSNLAFGRDNPFTGLLSSRGLKDPKTTSHTDKPSDLAPSFTVSTEFTASGLSEWLAGTVQKSLPGADAFMGSSFSAGTTALNAKMTEAAACQPNHAIEHVALELPASYTLMPHLPADIKIETSALSFTATWRYQNHTLILEREVTTKFATALCPVVLGVETAAALTRVREQYNTKISLGATAATNDTADADTFKAAIEALKTNDSKTSQRLLSELLSHPISEQNAFAAHMARGVSYFRAGQLNQAIEDFSAAIRLKPDGDLGPYEMRARSYLRIGKRELALADLDVAIKRAPDDVMLREVHADVATAAHDFTAAAADYDIIVKSKPDDQRVLLMRAVAHYGAKHYTQAAADYEHAGRLGASEITVLNGLCESLARTDKLGEASYHCSRALEINPLAGLELESRGLVYFRQGKFAHALEDFEKAASTYPQNARYLYERGLTKVKLGDTVSGQRDIKKAKDADPSVGHEAPAEMAP